MKNEKMLALNVNQFVAYYENSNSNYPTIKFMEPELVDEGIHYPAQSFQISGNNIEKLRDFLNSVLPPNQQ